MRFNFDFLLLHTHVFVLLHNFTNLTPSTLNIQFSFSFFPPLNRGERERQRRCRSTEHSDDAGCIDESKKMLIKRNVDCGEKQISSGGV